MGGGRGGLPNTKSGWGVGCCECPLETILPNFGLGPSPNSFDLFKSTMLYNADQ